MIKASELRLGSYYEIVPPEDGSVVWTVKGIQKLDQSHFWMAHEDSCELAECLNPIGLIPEILEGCGFYFTKEDQSYRLKTNPHGILLTKGLGSIIAALGRHNVFLKYVHELQNLFFALTGEELKVNL